MGLISAGPLTPLRAADRAIAIPATTLDMALTTLARQTGGDIVSVEPGLRQVRVAPLAGAMSLREALARLLAGSGYRAIRVNDTSYRIVRGETRRVAARPAAAASPSAVAGDIIVTASKQHVALLRYPGAITVVSGLASPGAPRATPDMDGAARTLPVLQSTALGAGRDKLFIRGVADSSFNGATQSTASMYFGDVPLIYAGPEPDLRLYDMQDVEVMEGPQGTLYGAGAIGGIIRLTPAPVDLRHASGAVEAGVSATASGEPGFDASARIDMPLAEDVAGLRGVAYRIRDGGYIDDRGQGRRDVNRVDTVGGRLAGRVDPGNGWDIELSGLFQRVDGRDAQYADGPGHLTRTTLQAQPYHSAFALGRLVVTKAWDSGLELTSATGVSDDHAGDLFDATSAMPGATEPIAYRTDNARLLLTQEARLSRSLPGGNRWVVGLTLLSNRDTQSRETGPIDNPIEIIGVTNVTRSASLFGEGTLALSSAFSATLGARLTYARTDGEPSTQPINNAFI
ncbi:MAG: TonB-dependent receptor, partial [Sphingomonas sp.]